MKIGCYLSQGCASEEALKTNITLALKKEGIQAEVNFYWINDAEALSRGLSGSPSVFINEREIQPTGTVGFSWRMFMDESGRLMNVPSVEILQKAMSENK